MTFRSRPAQTRTRSRQSSRKTLYTNLFFSGVVLLALLILAVAAGVNWWSSHWQAVATVNGQSVTKDDFSNRIRVDLWRLNAVESKIRDAYVAGLISKAQQDQELATIAQEKSNPNTIYGSSLQSLIDSRLQAQLAAGLGIVATDAQVDDRLIKEATTNEQRHVWVIEVAPEVKAPATVSTVAQDLAAQARAQAYLARLTKGEDWAAVAKEADPLVTDSGDRGFLASQTSALDRDLATAVFALPEGGLTGVAKGADGTYRIARVTQIVPKVVDPNYAQTIVNANVPIDLYRQIVRSDIIRDALREKVVADETTKPTTQRHVLEIKLTQQTDSQTNQPILTDQVDVRHILYAPGGAAGLASPPPSNDPSWDAAKAKADATYQALLKDPSKFQAIAKTDSADTGSGASGGDIGYQSQASLDTAFGTAIFKPGLKKDEILPPVKSVYGWHVIQFIDRRAPALTRINGFINDLAKPGADFAAIAKANSEAIDASKGGDMGWIAHHQLSKTLEDKIFALPVGSVSDMVTDNANLYLFKVLEEQSRLPDADQISTLTSNGFSNWYAAETAKATIHVDPAYSQYLSGAGA
jgi:parvulin-like peptidyl-prolyl isomerase